MKTTMEDLEKVRALSEKLESLNAVAEKLTPEADITIGASVNEDGNDYESAPITSGVAQAAIDEEITRVKKTLADLDIEVA